MSTLNEHQPLTRDFFIARSKSFGPILVKHFKTHAITWALLISLYGVIHANYRLAINQTPSLPYTLFLICLNDSVETEGLIAFKWHNGAPYPDGYTFTKRLLASPGDVVTRKGRNFVVGDRTLVGKEIGLSLKKLFPNDELHEGKNTIQLNKYFVAGDHEYSLDSRYNLLGLVDKKMSLAVPTRFSSSLLAALMLHLSSSIAWAGEDDFFIKDLMKEQQPNMNRPLPDWLKTQPATLSPVFEKVLREGNNGGQGKSDGVGAVANSQKPIQGRWIFVSMGMPAQELKAAAEEAAATKSVLVFRGVEKGGDTGTITRGIYPIVKDIKPVPGAVIDPILFTRFNVQAVPAMIETNAAGETRSARGLPGFNWMSKQDAGDLGQRGPVFGILEPDMIEEMQRRMAEYDWDKEKQHAMDNFWANQQDTASLAVAEKNTERRIDMSIVSSKDIFHPDGRLIIKKGQKINPQTILPMRHAYILFDATNKRQVEIAKKVGDALLAKQQPVVYLFSKMNTEKGWDHYNQTIELMNAPIYKLNKTIIERFKIQALPSVVEGQGDLILVREIDARVLN